MPDKPTISDRMDEKFKDVNQTYLSKMTVPQDPIKIDDYFEDVSREYEFRSEEKTPVDDMKKRVDEKTRKPKM